MTVGSNSLSEEQIDELVIAQADDDSAWDQVVQVTRETPVVVTLPPDLAARIAFFAHLHREPNMEDWLARITRERLDLEETILAGFKRQLVTENS